MGIGLLLGWHGQNPKPMEPSTYRRRLLNMHGLLEDSGRALDKASESISAWPMRMLLSTLANRRHLMSGLLCNELGPSARIAPASDRGDDRFLRYLLPQGPRDRSGRILQDVEEEDRFVIAELDALVFSPFATDRARVTLMELLVEAEQDLHDLGAIRSDMGLTRA